MHIYPIQSTHMQAICVYAIQMSYTHPNELINKQFTFIVYDHPIASFNSYICKPPNISNISPQLEL